MRIIPYTLTQQGCTSPGRLFFVQWQIIIVGGFSLWNIYHIDIPMERILMCHIRLCKICLSLIYTLWNRTKSNCYHHPLVLVNWHLLSLSDRTQCIYSSYLFIFYKKICPFLSVKIRYKRNNINGKLYWNKCLSFIVIYFYIYF